MKDTLLTDTWWDPLTDPETPLRWRKPRAVHLALDLFGPHVSDLFITRTIQTIRNAPRHLFQVATRYPLGAQAWFSRVTPWDEYVVWGGGRPASYGGTGLLVGFTGAWPLENLWIGVQLQAPEDVARLLPPLLRIPATLRFAEARSRAQCWDLQHVALSTRDGPVTIHPLRPTAEGAPGLDWVIAAADRPTPSPATLSAVRDLRDQATAAGLPFTYRARRPGARRFVYPLLDGVQHPGNLAFPQADHRPVIRVLSREDEVS